MSRKVKVSLEVSKAIENYVSEYSQKDFLIAHCEPGEWDSKDRKCLNSISVMQLAEILVNGYEVELTPEENVEREFKTCKENGANDSYNRGKYSGIMYTLNMLGIKIKGVNE